MRIGYDPRGDILFVDLETENGIRERRVGGQHLSQGAAFVDLAADGTILAIEIQGASKRYPREALEGFNAYPDEPIALSEASSISGIDAEALKKAGEENWAELDDDHGRRPRVQGRAKARRPWYGRGVGLAQREPTDRARALAT